HDAEVPPRVRLCHRPPHDLERISPPQPRHVVEDTQCDMRGRRALQRRPSAMRHHRPRRHPLPPRTLPLPTAPVPLDIDLDVPLPSPRHAAYIATERSMTRLIEQILQLNTIVRYPDTQGSGVDQINSGKRQGL